MKNTAQFLQIYLTCLILSEIYVLAVQEYPKVSVLRWLSSGDHIDWEYDNITADAITIKEQDAETVYTVSPHIYAMSMSCNASYPVQWVCTGPSCGDANSASAYFSARIRSYREAQTIDNPKSYKYSSILELTTESSRNTGAYSCQSVSSERIQNNIYVYCLGNSPPYLILAGQSVHVKSQDDNKTIILPCTVATPTAQVILEKETAGSFLPEPPSPYISYDPKIGFTLNVQQMSNPYGSYKCTIDKSDDEDDFVLVTSLKGLGTQNHTEIMEGNSSFGYDPEARVIRCCASGPRPPNMHNMYCDDANTCKVLEKYVLQGGNNGIKLHNSSCTVLHPYYRDTGVLRCKGDGIDVIRHYFTSFEDYRNHSVSPFVYFNWNDADPSKFLLVEPHSRGSYDGKFYSNQTLYVSCDTSSYYFAEGILWSLKWHNGTLQFLDDSYSAYPGDYPHNLRSIKFQADKDMESLTCYAPIWNSSEWANHTYQFKIYQSQAPTLVGPQLEVVTWAINQTNVSILCNIDTGKPAPYIRWRKNNRIMLNTTNTRVQRTNSSSILTFRRVYQDVAGEYHCMAGNVAGRTERVVRIIVQSPTASSFGATGIVVTVVVLLLFTAGLGILVWKMKLQKKIIDHLTGVVFRDMSSSSQNIVST